MTSQSAEGTVQITLQVPVWRSMDFSGQDVQAAINAAAVTLRLALPVSAEPIRRSSGDERS